MFKLTRKENLKIKARGYQGMGRIQLFGSTRNVTVLNADVGWATGVLQYTAGECSQMPRGRAAFNPGSLALKPHP